MSRAVDSTARAMAGEALSRLDNGGSGSGGTTVDAYSKLETNNLLNAKVDDVEFTPIKALAESNEINITYLANNKAEKTEVNALSELVADIDSEVDLKANKADVYTKTETNAAISDKVAEIVANAPEDFDTLKEMSDWIDSHEDSASTMNTAIKQNTSDIANLQITDETTATEIAGLQEQITAISDCIADTGWVDCLSSITLEALSFDETYTQSAKIRKIGKHVLFRGIFKFVSDGSSAALVRGFLRKVIPSGCRPSESVYTVVSYGTYTSPTETTYKTILSQVRNADITLFAMNDDTLANIYGYVVQVNIDWLID